jgi:hypothetical protein
MSGSEGAGGARGGAARGGSGRGGVRIGDGPAAGAACGTGMFCALLREMAVQLTSLPDRSRVRHAAPAPAAPRHAAPTPQTLLAERAALRLRGSRHHGGCTTARLWLLPLAADLARH